MLQNKIYYNFLREILKTFLLILFGLAVIALTVRAVSFLDLIVENGYPVGIYFKYSVLNLFGILPKFIPLAFLLALTIFIHKHKQDGEFVILWTSGVKKIHVVNLFFITSIITVSLYILFSAFLTPIALNKSRLSLSDDNLNSFLPTIRSQQFSDSFKGFTFIVEKKINDEIKHIFLHDDGNNLKNLSSNISKTSSTTIVAEMGKVDERKLFLINGQIISTKKNSNENEIIKFDQLNIDLGGLSTTTIKKPKIQETSTIKLMKCILPSRVGEELCNKSFIEEVIPALNRRMILPFYIPVISLICSMLLIKSNRKYFQKFSIFLYSFMLVVFTELALRYTGINSIIKFFYLIAPVILAIFFYFFLKFNFSRESKI